MLERFAGRLGYQKTPETLPVPVEPSIPSSPKTAITPRRRRDSYQNVPVGAVTLPWWPASGQNTIYEWRVATLYNMLRARGYAYSDGYASEAVELLVDHVVTTTGISVRFSDPEIDQMWQDWKWNPGKDTDDVSELQRYITRNLVRDGEAFFQFIGTEDCFYVAEIDALDLPVDGGDRPFDRNRQGIQFDEHRRPVRYNFRPYINQGQSYSLDAHQVVHVFRKLYPYQVRGITWLRAGFQSFDLLLDLEQNFVRVLDMIVKNPGFFSMTEDLHHNYDNSIDPDDVDVDDEVTTDDVLDPKALLEYSMRLAYNERSILPQGVEWVPLVIPNILNGSVLDAGRRALLSRIARSCGLSYFSVSSDLASSNYSSLQQGSAEDKQLYRSTQQLLKGAMEKIVKQWITWHQLRYPMLAARLDQIDVDYGIPSWAHLDPSKELSSQETAVGLGLSSRQELIRESGRDPMKVMAERIEEAVFERMLDEIRGRTEDGSPDGGSTNEDNDKSDKEESNG